MAEVVTLQVNVDKSQLTALQADITKLRATPITLRVTASGAANVRKLTQATRDYGVQVNRVMSATGRMNNQMSRTAEQTARAGDAVRRSGRAWNEYRQSASRTQNANNTIARSANQAQKSVNSLGATIASTAKMVGTSMVTAALIYKPIAAFKEALETMKAVDSELVNVGKVTKWPEERLKAMGEQAYKTASAYGVAANEYLSSVTEFTRAGYLEQSEALAELATKTQIVGDTTADVANQFLLAVDKGYQMGGSVEKLSAVLDGANEIGNNFATSIPKIAEGLGKVAPIGAQAKVGIDELSAAIGTVTAVTQRSGTEAATALRALFLNIMGDTKTEIDEGVTWTTGEISGLRDVLNIYASDVVAAADATGSLINPMEAIGALSQSMKDGVLTEQKLMEMVSDIGGKLRTSQLLALIQNWDMYEAMLDKYKNAAGSADREVERAMDSWERKAEVLKNTWTQFVSHMVETDAIKGAITGVTEVISGLDSDFGQAAMKAALFATSIGLISKAVMGIGKAVMGSNLATLLPMMFSSRKDFATGLSLLLKANPAVTIAGIATATALLVKGLREVAPTVENARKELEGLQEQMEEGFGASSEYADLISRADSLNEVEKRRLTILQAQKDILDQQIKDAQDLEFERFQGSLGIGDERIEAAGGTLDYKRLEKFNKVQDNLSKSFMEGKLSAKEYRAGLSDLAVEMEDYYNSLKKYDDSGYELTNSQEAMIDAYENMLSLLGTVEDAYLTASVALEHFYNTAEIGEKTVFNGEALQKSLEDAGATKEQIESILTNVKAKDTNIVFSVTGDAGEALDTLKELEIAKENASGEIEIDYSAFSGLMNQLGYTNGETSSLVQNLRELGGITFTNLPGQLDATGPKIESISEQTQNAKRQLDALGKTKATPQISLQDGDAKSKIQDIINKLNSIPRSIRVAIQANPIGFAFSNAVGALGKFFASGTDNAPGGKAMVNELGPEIIREGSTARIAGGGHPTITTLSRGAQVFTAEETKDILTAKRPDIPVPAFARGTGFSEYSHSTPDKKGEESVQTNSNSGGSTSGGKKTKTSNSKKSSSSGQKTSSSGGGTDSKLDALKEDLELLRAQYSFLEASGAGADALTAKSREIQAALNNINNHLRAANGEQKDILDNSSAWWKELEAIQKVQREAFQKERDLLESQIELGQKLGVNTENRLSRLKQIQDSLAREAEYLRSIGASQEEINQLSIQWWETQEDIRDVQQELWDELEDAVAAELKRAQIARDEEIDALDRRLQEMKEARDAKEDELTLEEKLLKVEEARAALENAQNERTIRTYNAASGQWEWVADAKRVEDAKKNLAEAEKDLEEYRADLAYEEAVKAIERRKEAINAAYDALEEGWEDIIESVQEPAREIGDILADIAKNGTPLMKEQVENTRRLLEDLNNYISSAISTNTGDSFYGANGSLGEYGAGGGLSSKDYSKDTTDYSALMYRAKDLAEFNYWAEQRTNKMNAQGIDPTAAGFKTNAEIFKEWESGKQKGEQSSGSTRPSTSSGSSGGSSGSSGGNKVVKVTADGSAPKGLGVGDSVVTGGGTYTITGVNKDGSYNSIKSSNTTTQTYKGKYDKYDQGGILKGLGGIKATAANEMILPPDITAKMLAPTSNEVFEQRMKELGLLYGAPQALQSPAVPQGARAGGDTYNNGNTYQYGNITLTESQAKGMSVYEMAQMARNLRLFNGR